MIKIPGMIMIGASGRNVGKTEFACSLIRKFSSQCDVIGIKVTTIENTNTSCHRGETVCDAFTSFEGVFCFVRRMIRQSKDFDAVLPQVGACRYEPLFAIYRKKVLVEIDKVIASKRYRVIDPLENCKVKYIDLPGEKKLRNLNTLNDYREFVGKDKSVNI